MIGASVAMQLVYDLLARVAPTSSTVLIAGETGTGKELVAETIHQLSRRSQQACVPLNCGAVAPTLIESELFGHERGSFTGADQRRKGIFERANGGTLFLDEITEMPAELQVKLLRILETGTTTRVGGDHPIAADVRVLAATNRDPARAVRDGKLREDLLYRLNVFPIEVPPLRERKGDIPLLAQSFLKRLNKDSETSKAFTPSAVDRLEQHHWPGNVRELKNAVERAHIVASDRIDADALPALGNLLMPPAVTTGQTADRSAVGSSLADVKQHLILATMEHCGGDKKRAAEMPGISLKTLYNSLAIYGATKKRTTTDTSNPAGTP